MQDHHFRIKTFLPSVFVITALFLGTLSLKATAGTDLNDWTKSIRPVVVQKMLHNISVPGGLPGAIIASPSKMDPDYYYHWVRDAGLVTLTLLTEYEKASLPSEREQYLQILNDSISFSLRLQKTSQLGKGLGEPRFNLDGSLSPASNWPSPQDDGPALRAASMIRLANIWISEGHEDWVREKLYKAHGESLVKADLEFLSHNWRRTSFDLWEELHGHHFFTRLAQRRALVDGGNLAIHLGDYEAGGWYLQQAQALEAELQRHWDPAKGYILSTLDRDGGINYKEKNLDTSVILAVLASSMNDNFFSVTDEKVQLTALKLTETFKQLYTINQNGTEGVAIGRYPEDRYDGVSPDGKGNPWVLTTAALAEFYYRLARSMEMGGTISITPRKLQFFNAIGVQGLSLEQRLGVSHPSFTEVLQKLRNTGDSFLARIKAHGHSNGAFAEQINRETGMMQGAQDLTWSYASVISAINHRH